MKKEDPIDPLNSRWQSRRGFLKAMTGLMAGSGAVELLSRQVAAQENAKNPGLQVMADLSVYMADARNRSLPDDVVEHATHHILDTFAAMVSGATLPSGRAAIKFAQVYGGRRVSTVAGSSVVCGPIEAALVNGMLAHADETDDYWFENGWHPGANVVPAGLAVGEQFDISGPQFLRAVVLGYDIGARVIMTLRPSLLETHSMVGTFAAAAAAGAAANLSAQQMRWLLDYTSQQSSGTSAWDRDADHIEKGFVFGGMPARNGVTAALAVQSGWNGVDDILSGQGNFISLDAPNADPRGLVDGLGKRYEVARTHMKKWSVGAPIQAPLDALEIILKRAPFEAAQVREVVVRMSPGSVVDNREMPDINIQYMIAVMLVDKTVTFRSAHDKTRMNDPEILRQRAKVRLVPGTQADGPANGQSPLIVVTLLDGTRLSQDVDAVLGTITNPMSRDQLLAKCRDLVTPVLGATTCTRLIETTLGLQSLSNIRTLRRLLQHG